MFLRWPQPPPLPSIIDRRSEPRCLAVACNYYEGGKRARGGGKRKGDRQTDGEGTLFARLAPKQVLWMIARNINGPRASEKVKAACGISPWIILADS